MADAKLRILTKEENAQEQKNNPDGVVLPMGEQQFEEGSEFLKKLREREEKFPILKRTKESIELSSIKRELYGHYLAFIDNLEYLPLSAAIQNWLFEFDETTRLKYAAYMTDMLNRKIIHEFFADGKVFTIGGFRHVRHEQALEYIKNVPDWSEGSRQSRAACYLSFTAYLHQISYGWFRRALPSNSDENRTFYRLKSKTIMQALSLENWHKFLDKLDEENLRDSLIARCMLYGGHRVSEILNLKIDQLDFEKNIIRFSRGRDKRLELPVVYPASFINELKEYIQETSNQRKDSGFIFVTRNGKPLTRSRLNYSFAHASAQADVEKVTPEALRATWAMFKREDNIDDKVLKIKRYNFK